MDRKFDIVVFAATGRSGRQLAGQLAIAQKKQGFSWAIAGRSLKKLNALKRSIKPYLKSSADVGLIKADCTNYLSLLAMCAQSRYLISALGAQGSMVEAVVRACIDRQCHYIDSTADTALTDFLRRKYHDLAVARQAQVITMGSVESALKDLAVGALLAELSAPEEAAPDTLREAVEVELYQQGGEQEERIAKPLSGADFRDYQRLQGCEASGRVIRLLSGLPHWQSSLQGWARPKQLAKDHPVIWSAIGTPDYGIRFEYGEFSLHDSLPQLLVQRARRLIPANADRLLQPLYARYSQDQDSAELELRLFAHNTQAGASAQLTTQLSPEQLLVNTVTYLLEAHQASDQLGQQGGVLSPALALDGQQFLAQLQGQQIQWTVEHG